MSILLKNASLLTEEAKLLKHKDLWIADDRISRICDTGSYQPRSREEEPAETIDCSDMIVSPGIPNLHVHAAMNIFKGIAEDVTSDVWFNEMIWPYESKMTPEDAYVGTLLGIGEMINNGVTAMADHYFYEKQVLQAVNETGIRADLAPTVFGMTPDYRERLDEAVSFIREHRQDSDRTAFHIGPHAPYTCPDETLSEMADIACSMDLPVHIHVAEEGAQVVTSYERSGRSPFRVLADCGVFRCRVLAAHGLWIGEEDLQYLNDNTWFAFCPKTYMKLASGRGGFFDVHDHLHYGFGTDGAASSNTLNPVEQARLLGLLGKYQDNDAAAFRAEELWKHLIGGHAALPFGAGHLQEGAPADLVIWDLNTPETFPYYNPISAILYSSNSRNVRYTMVAGTFLKYDGKLRMDIEGLQKQAAELQRALLQRGMGKAEMIY